MRAAADVFHLAVPVSDLGEARHFYVTLLGCKLARTYPDRITLDFFGDQLVCHLTETSAGAPPAAPGGAPPTAPPTAPPHGQDRSEPLSLYPRHFGVTFRDRRDFDLLHDLVELRKVTVFMGTTTRFEGTPEEHRTFVLRDPFDNLLEFKHYRDPRMMY